MPFWTLDISITSPLPSNAFPPPLVYAPLELTVVAECDGRKPTIEPGTSVSGSFAATQPIPGTGMSATLTSSDVENEDLALMRHLVWPADPTLEIADIGKDQPAGTIRLIGNLRMEQVEYQIAGTKRTMSYGAALRLDMAYDPSKADQSITADTTLFVGSEIAGAAHVTIKRSTATLLYQANDTIDMLDSLPVMRGDFPKSVNATLAVGSGEVLIHGNSHIGVMVDGADQASKYATVRLKRSWTYKLLADDTRGALTGRGVWGPDTTAAGASWDDVPGIRTPVAPEKWPREEQVDEYLVRVDKMPEFGALYFAVIINRKPNFYKIRLYAAENIDLDTWCTIRNSSAPYESQAAFGQNDDSWRPVVRTPPAK